MTIEEAKERIQRLIDRGVITVTEGRRRMEDPNLLANTSKAIERETRRKEEIIRRISEIEAKNTALVSKQPNVIKVGDLVKLDPLFLESEVLGLVTEIRKTKRMNFVYVKWAGKKPIHHEISERLGTKEYYFIKA